MSEYIEREALQKLFNEVSTSLLCKKELTKDTEHMIRAFLMVTEMIQDAPAVDVVPVVHGKWIEKSYLLGISNFCSKCGENFGMPHGKFNFCPNCGAKMDLEEEQ